MNETAFEDTVGPVAASRTVIFAVPAVTPVSAHSCRALVALYEKLYNIPNAYNMIKK